MGSSISNIQVADYSSQFKKRYNAYLLPATIPTLDAICDSCSDAFAISAAVIAAGTENKPKEEVVGGISITSERCSNSFIQLV